MFKSRQRQDASSATADRHRPPPPVTPIEIGFSLRAAREKAGLSTSQVRERTDVPLVDLDALENGRLDLFHVEQAAVVALWRYAEAVGLEPDPLVEVIHRSWPNPSLGIDAFRSTNPLVATPLAQLAIASSMLSPISRPTALASASANIGLSKSTLNVLSAASHGASEALSAIGPGRAVSAAPQVAAVTSTSTPVLEPSTETAPPKPLATALKAVAESNAATVAKKLAPRAAAILNAARATSETSTLRQFPTPTVPAPEPQAPEVVEEVVIEQPDEVEEVAPERVVHMDDTQAVQRIDVEPPTPPKPVTPRVPATPVAGHWVARLSKVFAERFGVEVTPKDE